MKNEAREAVANLRETLEEMIEWRNRISGTALYTGDMMQMSYFIVRLDKQIDILEAIDDNDIMEHAYSQTKDWEPGEVYNLYPVDDDPDTLRMEQVQPEDC